MSQLKEAYEKILLSIQKINDKVISLGAQINAINEQVDRTIPDKVKALRKQLDEIDSYEARINKIRIGAERHLYTKNVPSKSPRPINFNRLRNWSKMIDPELTDDPYAQRVYIMCECNLLFLQEKRKEYRKALMDLQAIDTSEIVADLDTLEAERDKALKEYDALIVGEQFQQFAELLRKAHGELIYDKLPEHYEKNDNDNSSIPLGARAKILPFPENYRAQVSAILDKYYDKQSGCIWYPLELDGKKEQTIFVSYSSNVETKNVNRGLQNYLFHIMDGSRTGGNKICFCDALHYNASILGPLKALEDTEVLQRLPRNPEQITQQLKEIIARFSDYDEILGLYDSVIDFNADEKNEEKLERTTLFLVGYPTAFPNDAKEAVQRIAVNAERYGVSLIIVDTYNEKDGVKYKNMPEHIADKGHRIVMDQRKNSIQAGVDDEETGFIWYFLPKQISETYLEDIKKLVKDEKNLGNVYPKRIDLENVPQYERGKKNLELPVAVDQRDEMHSISFENENFAHFLMGASGSGKSTLLHTIITGIIRNYHPDDVELWLADFKMSEFAQYMDPMPPHIKYILLDESQELVYDLIDKLTEKMMERQRFFMQHREMKKVENVPSNIYMPVIFVILDEFSIMSQSIAESEAYKLKLQNLLAKGRALGIKFIFSSQTFIKGIAGLTPTAKEQIQTRIAMKNSFDEINETLELSSNTRTDQIKNWMDALPPHYILLKYRDGDHMNVKRLQVMYFDGKAEEAMEPQRKLIRSLNDTFEVVASDAYGSKVTSYVDKQPVIVDGNAYDKYDQEIMDKCIADYKRINERDVIGDEMFLAFGTPRLMVKNKLCVMSSETRENALLIARTSEQTLAMSIILSTIKNVIAQGKSAEVWVYGRHRMYLAYKDLFNKSGATIVEGIDSICDAIRDVKASIQNRVNNERMIILVGMDRICADFELIDGAGTQGASRASRVAHSGPVEFAKSTVMEDRQKLINNGAGVSSDDEELKREFTVAWMSYSKERKNALKAEGKSRDEIKELLKPEMAEYRIKFYKEHGVDLEAEATTNAETANNAEAASNAEAANSAEATANAETADSAENVTKAETANSAEATAKAEAAGNSNPTLNAEVKNEEIKAEEAKAEVQKGAYAALDDFAYIIRQGSRMGTHFMLALNSLADIKQCGIKPDLFRYKMTFQLSADESRNLFNNKIASTLPEHICQYDDTYDRYSFRPYLHEGISWDGWTVDSDGTVINPMM